MYLKGIHCIYDLLDDNNNFLSSDEINLKYNLRTDFLEILQVRMAIPLHWRQTIRTINRNRIVRNQIPKLYSHKIDNYITLNKLKSKTVYWLLISNHLKNITPPSIGRWNGDFHIDENKWQQIFLNSFINCRSTKLQTFQYRIIHRTITCNHWLYNAKIKPSPDCDLCNIDDTLTHFFVSCQAVTVFWSQMKRWWARICNNIQLTDEIILLGHFKKPKHNLSPALNFILILAKKFIHDSKMNGSTYVSFLAFLQTLKQQISYEKQICLKNNNHESFLSKFSNINDVL